MCQSPHTPHPLTPDMCVYIRIHPRDFNTYIMYVYVCIICCKIFQSYSKVRRIMNPHHAHHSPSLMTKSSPIVFHEYANILDVISSH